MTRQSAGGWVGRNLHVAYSWDGKSTGRPTNCMGVVLSCIQGPCFYKDCCSNSHMLRGHSCLLRIKWKVCVKVSFEPQAFSLQTFSTNCSSRSVYSSWSTSRDFLEMYDPKPLRQVWKHNSNNGKAQVNAQDLITCELNPANTSIDSYMCIYWRI